MNHFRYAAAVGAVALSLLLLPLSASAHDAVKSKPACTKTNPHRLTSSASGAVFTFGIQGGNIRPWSVSLNADGSVTPNGWETPHNTKLANPSDTLNGLLMLATSEGFFAMPAQTNCPGTLPDVGSRYIDVNNGSTSKEVKVHGNCVAGFNALVAVLENTADIQH